MLMRQALNDLYGVTSAPDVLPVAMRLQMSVVAVSSVNKQYLRRYYVNFISSWPSS